MRVWGAGIRDDAVLIEVIEGLRGTIFFHILCRGIGMDVHVEEGTADEVGLMQVTPAVAREWAKETGLKEFERQAAENVNEFMADPERNIQVGCWYLEKLREPYRTRPAETAMTLAAYNAGPSRVEEWTRDADAARMPEADFVGRINIPSTRSYVTTILERYRTAPSPK